MIISHENSRKRKFIILLLLFIQLGLLLRLHLCLIIDMKNCTFIVDSGVLCIIKDDSFTISYFQHIFFEMTHQFRFFILSKSHFFHTYKENKRNMLYVEETLMQTMMKS